MRGKIIESLLMRLLKKEKRSWQSSKEKNEILWEKNLFSDLNKLGGQLIVMKMG